MIKAIGITIRLMFFGVNKDLNTEIYFGKINIKIPSNSAIHPINVTNTVQFLTQIL